MRRWLIFSVSLWTVAGAPEDVVDDTEVPGVTDTGTEDVWADVDAQVEALMNDAQIAGLAVAVTRPGEVVWTQAHGLANVEENRPVTHDTASVTVLTENAMLADAWATALLVVGRERGMEIAERQNLAALFIDREVTSGKMRFKTYATDQFDSIQHS